MSRSVEFTGRTRMHAEVGQDAKLDLIDIDDTQTANIDLGGANQEFGPVNLIYTGIHHARVDMPGGNYVPGQGAVDISLTARGVTVGGSALGKAGNDIAADLDRTFAALVDRELGNVRSREAGWNEANACVDVQFNPASLTLKLHRGGHGSVSAQAVAKEGGGASEGHWTRTGQQNATFGPDQADGAAPSFSYDVTNAGKDVVVTLGVRVTSKAGVGEGTWQQETDDLALYRGTVTGTYSVSGGCGGSWEWSYSARLADIVGNDQPFPIIDPASGGGPEGGGAAGYDETLTGTINYPPCGSDLGCSSDLSIDYGYGVLLFDADADTVTASMEPPPIKSGCGSLVNTLGEASFPRSMVGADTITLHFPYDDGVTTTSGTLTLTRVN